MTITLRLVTVCPGIQSMTISLSSVMVCPGIQLMTITLKLVTFCPGSHSMTKFSPLGVALALCIIVTTGVWNMPR
jgi:hypothetical protein